MTKPNKYQIMPDMTPEQFAALKADIAEKGVLQPIEFDKQGNVVDGHNRYRAFAELIAEGHDLPMFPKMVRDYPDEDAKIEHIISFNVERRHLTPEQRRQLIVTLRQRGFSMPRIAHMIKVSTGTVFNDIQGLTAEDRAELEKAVITGADGRQRSAIAPKIVLMSGHAQLREMQQTLINAAADKIKQSGYVIASDPAGDDSHAMVISQDMADAAVTAFQAVSNGTVKPTAASTISDSDARERMTAFSWYGGKSSHLKWLLPLLPPCQHFVDVFGGSGAVLMNREPSPIETYNDLDSNVVSFFRVLREKPDELARLLALTPYSREERRLAYEQVSQEYDGSDLERARMFFVLARQSRSGLAQSRHSVLNSWRFTRDRIANGLAVYNHQWDEAIDGLAAVAARFKRVQIENYSWDRVIPLYDTPTTLFYCDPPYVHDTRKGDHKSEYAFEMTDNDHVKLSVMLHSIKGRAAVSGYPSDLYDELYHDWHKVLMPVTATAGSGGADHSRIECLWANYPTVTQ